MLVMLKDPGCFMLSNLSRPSMAFSKTDWTQRYFTCILSLISDCVDHPLFFLICRQKKSGLRRLISWFLSASSVYKTNRQQKERSVIPAMSTPTTKEQLNDWCTFIPLAPHPSHNASIKCLLFRLDVDDVHTFSTHDASTTGELKEH